MPSISLEVANVGSPNRGNIHSSTNICRPVTLHGTRLGHEDTKLNCSCPQWAPSQVGGAPSTDNNTGQLGSSTYKTSGTRPHPGDARANKTKSSPHHLREKQENNDETVFNIFERGWSGKLEKLWREGSKGTVGLKTLVALRKSWETIHWIEAVKAPV